LPNYARAFIQIGQTVRQRPGLFALRPFIAAQIDEPRSPAGPFLVGAFPRRGQPDEHRKFLTRCAEELGALRRASPAWCQPSATG